MVSPNRGQPKGLQPIGRFTWIEGAGKNIAEVDDHVGALPIGVIQHSI